MNSAAELAQKLSSQGWHVFPCLPDKKPRVKWKRKNTKWTFKPDDLIGIWCEESGFFAIDIDRKQDLDGFKAWNDLVEKHGGPPPVGPMQRTPSGGCHLLFNLPEDVKVPNNAGVLAPGVDLRSNGYICSGAGYTWLEGYNFDEPLTDAPDWLLDEIRKMTETSTDRKPDINVHIPSRDIDDPGEYWLQRYLSQAIPESNRNDLCFDLACQLRDEGYSQAEAEKYIRRYAQNAPGKGFTIREALTTMKSAYKQTKREPAKSSSPGPIKTEPKQPTEETYIDIEKNIVEHRTIEPEETLTGKIPEVLKTWLDDYIEFSRKWSPRAFDAYHEACGLFVLSTIAARRVKVHLGKPRFTNLYIGLLSRSSLWAKSTTADIAIQTLNSAYLGWLLSADSATPQKFIRDLTGKLPENYDSLPIEQKDWAKARVGMPGQRGWFYDEFGQHVNSMMRQGGFMSEFRGLLRRFDDTPDRYEYGTIGRGNDIILKPYLSLLVSMTPADLRPFAKRGSALWGDGFLARFALITPSNDDRKRDRFPTGERKIPTHIVKPLVEWNRRLKLPKVTIETVTAENGNNKNDKKIVNVEPVPETELHLSNQVFDAYYDYDEFLLDIVDSSNNEDLDANYARFSEKAIRISALLASLEGSDTIKLGHWERARMTTERWRSGLHELYEQLNEPSETQERTNEERILTIIGKKEPTRRQLRQSTKWTYAQIEAILAGLLKDKLIAKKKQGKTEVYYLLEPVEV